ATYRLFDWNRTDAQGRSRELHVAESLACTDWRRGPVAPVRAADFGSRRRARQALGSWPAFALGEVAEDEPFRPGGAGAPQAGVVLAGRGRWAGGEELVTGQTWVLPAALPPVECRPDGWLSLLLATLP